MPIIIVPFTNVEGSIIPHVVAISLPHIVYVVTLVNFTTFGGVLTLSIAFVVRELPDVHGARIPCVNTPATSLTVFKVANVIVSTVKPFLTVIIQTTMKILFSVPVVINRLTKEKHLQVFIFWELCGSDTLWNFLQEVNQLNAPDVLSSETFAIEECLT